MSFTPTEEQLAIIAAAKSTRDNMLVQALAGAAKTSTLELIAKALPGQPILCVAFNKRIADEMGQRLPSHCVAKTMNSIGHSAWGQFTGKRLNLNKGKMGDILKSMELSRGDQEELREVFGDVVRLASRAKLYGYIPEGKFDEGVHLIDRETLEEILADDEYPELAWRLLDQMVTRSITQAYDGTIDFDDQIFMSSLFGAQLPRFPLVLVDEAQDLSPLNHYMIGLLVQNRRLIAVGDSFQSIYGFRGAVSDGMNVLRQRFQMQEFRLSISFRCPKEIILLARKRAPYMQWADNAIDGEVHDLTSREGWKIPNRYGQDAENRVVVDDQPSRSWGPNLFPTSAAVICRNNAPLFSLGLKLLRAGRGITIRGMDISKRLIKILTEFGDRDMDREELIGHLSRWRAAKLAEGKLKEETIEDRFACLMVFAQATPTLGAAIAHAEALFSAEGPIELLSGHKSKGLEWNHVFHLDPWRVPSKFARSFEELTQEDNLEYVITTRAKQSLTFINLEDYDEEAE
jgi:superfamily I DNA/RNA helicase